MELEFQCPGRGRSHRFGITLVEGVGFPDFVALMTFQLMAMEETFLCFNSGELCPKKNLHTQVASTTPLTVDMDCHGKECSKTHHPARKKMSSWRVRSPPDSRKKLSQVFLWCQCRECLRNNHTQTHTGAPPERVGTPRVLVSRVTA